MKKNIDIVQFSHVIDKNTAEFDMFDMLNFYEWLHDKKWKPSPKKSVTSCKIENGKVQLTWR